MEFAIPLTLVMKMTHGCGKLRQIAPVRRTSHYHKKMEHLNERIESLPTQRLDVHELRESKGRLLWIEIFRDAGH